MTTAYLAPPGYEEQLAKEIQGDFQRYDRLFILPEAQPLLWVQNTWHNPFRTHFESISEAAQILKEIQRNWAHYPYSEHRRAALIEEKLPYLSNKPIKFPATKPTAPLGSWTLLDKHTLLASPHCSSSYKNGELNLEECHQGPPSRAYLKLWEALIILGKMPQTSDKCLEVGSSPGGWTWVLAHLGTQVLSVDRSPLSPSIAALPGVQHKLGNAFSMTPETVGPVDWIFSDVACYPEKLLEWVNHWLESGLCKNYICTLKFQGDTSYDIAKQFLAIPGSQLHHLIHNKHELTWMLAK